MIRGAVVLISRSTKKWYTLNVSNEYAFCLVFCFHLHYSCLFFSFFFLFFFSSFPTCVLSPPSLAS